MHGFPTRTYVPLPDIKAVKGFAPAIDAAAAGADPRHAFLRRAWFQAAGGRRPVTLVVSRLGGQVVLALPIVKVAPFMRAVPGSYWPIRSFLIAADARDEELSAFLGSGLAKRVLGRIVRIGPANADDPAMSRIARVAPGAGWSLLKRRLATSFTLDIRAAREEGPWPRPSTLKKNRFHEKHLAGHGALEWRFVLGEDWTAALFDDLAQIEAKSWLGTEGGDAKFLAPRQRALWEKAAADPALAAMMHAGLLYVGGEPVAFSFGIEAGRTRYCIATSYDQAFAKHSPGKLIAYRTYADAAERGIELLDDGAGDGGHKTVMGEAPGPDIMDYLLVRGRAAATLLRPLWERSGR